MKKILETPRLYLRELCTDDARHFTGHAPTRLLYAYLKRRGFNVQGNLILTANNVAYFIKSGFEKISYPSPYKKSNL